MVLLVRGMFSMMYVPSRIVVPGDAAATASKLVASEWLFRASFARLQRAVRLGGRRDLVRRGTPAVRVAPVQGWGRRAVAQRAAALDLDWSDHAQKASAVKSLLCS
jgi:hypothetical protein